MDGKRYWETVQTVGQSSLKGIDCKPYDDDRQMFLLRMTKTRVIVYCTLVHFNECIITHVQVISKKNLTFLSFP